MFFPPGMLQLIVEAEVTHPPGTLLDEYGRPILDPETGEAMQMNQLRTENRRWL